MHMFDARYPGLSEPDPLVDDEELGAADFVQERLLLGLRWGPPCTVQVVCKGLHCQKVSG